MANIDKLRLSGVTYDIVDASAVHDLSNYSTTAQMNSAITAATAALAETISEQDYQTATDVQNAISGKADSTDVITNIRSYPANLQGRIAFTKNGSDTFVELFKVPISGGLVFDKGTNELSLSGVAMSADIPSVAPYADAVKYNSTSKEVEFYHGGTGGTKVFSYDASPFLIDGMVQNVEIKDVTISGESVTCLVISFNTDSGKQDINIPISDIFDASNYYTKTETDNAINQAIVDASGITSATVETMITAAVSGKADSSDVTALNSVVTAHTADTSIHVTSADKTNWNGKADAATTLAGYGITNAYTKSEVDTAVSAKNGVITLDGTTLVIS